MSWSLRFSLCFIENRLMLDLDTPEATETVLIACCSFENNPKLPLQQFNNAKELLDASGSKPVAISVSISFFTYYYCYWVTLISEIFSLKNRLIALSIPQWHNFFHQLNIPLLAIFDTLLSTNC